MIPFINVLCSTEFLVPFTAAATFVNLGRYPIGSDPFGDVRSPFRGVLDLPAPNGNTIKIALSVFAV
ncbi:hypothetical protein ACFX1Q_038509 [Malus domestica]